MKLEKSSIVCVSEICVVKIVINSWMAEIFMKKLFQSLIQMKSKNSLINVGVKTFIRYKLVIERISISWINHETELKIFMKYQHIFPILLKSVSFFNFEH